MKQIRACLIFLFVLCMAVAFGACTSKENTSKVTIRIAGQEADASGEYSVSMEAGEDKDFTLVVGTLKDYEFEVTSSSQDVATAAVTQTSLTINAVSEGSAKITISEKSDKANDLIVNVTVTASGDVVAPTGVSISNTSGGVGELDDPYTVSFSAGKTSEHNFVVRPSDADTAFVWSVGTLEGGNFTVDEDAALNVSQSNGKLVFTCDEVGAYSVRGEANVGDFAVYINVDVTEYTALTGIVADDLTESSEAEYDYYFKTAKGTTWDMTNGMAGRADAIMSGADGKSQYQLPLNLTYYPNLYKITFTAEPENATDTVWVMSYSEEGIFTLNTDGSWSANAAGSTIITVTNTSEEASIKIKVDVEDTLYNGVLKSEFDKLEADTELFWNFDSNPDDWEYTKAMLSDWQLVMNKTTNDPNGSDGNQKMFYLGDPNRVYGICLETRIDSSTGLNAGAVTALTWTKAQISDTATSMTVAIGNNDKTFGSYRITLVKEDGTSVCITNGWIEKSKANDDGKPYAEYSIPESFRGQTVAIVIETSLAQVDNNCELHIKGVWINEYKAVESVTLAQASAQVGQGGTYKIEASVTPSDASYKTLTYEVTSFAQGGEGKVTVGGDGTINVAADAPVGEYKIKVTSTDNAEATAEFTLTVIEYVPVTTFTGSLILNGREIAYEKGVLSGSTIRATFDETGIFTDPALTFDFKFNENASVRTYKIVSSEEGVVSISDGILTFTGAGTTTITVTPDDNPELAFSFTVIVTDYDESSSLIPGTKVTVTAAQMMGADDSTSWTNAAGMKKFSYNTVDRRHGNAKYNYDGDVMQFESHVVEANSQNPVNVGYNVISIGADVKYLTFGVHGHSDDRYLESSNIRVRVAYMNADAWTVDTVLDWTTIASRWKQEEEWYTIALDFSAYAGKDVVVIFEMVGGLQNNGNFPKGSDSSAGGYLYWGKAALVSELPEGAILASEGKIDDTYNTYRMYANSNTKADGWTVSAYGKGSEGTGSYVDGVYAPLTLTYTGSLSEVVNLTLTTDTFYSNKTEAALYPWGVFPALNNSENGSITLTSDNEEIFKVENGALVPVANGTAKLLVTANSYGTEDQGVTFEVEVKIAAVSKSVHANVDSVTLEAGKSYTLDYYTIPADAAVNYTVTAPEGAEESMYSVADGVFSTTANAVAGQYTVKIALADDAEVFDEVVITIAKVTEWANKTAILDANTGWTVNGSIDKGVGEGADLNSAGSYLSKTVTLSDLNTLTVGARVFVRDGETDFVMYISVVIDGQETRIKANGADGDTVTLSTTDSKYDSRNEYVYDLSAYAGQTVELRIGNEQGSHGVITDIKLS